MGRIASVALAARWRDRIERWRGSACGIGEFCRREGVSQASFYQWRKRLKTATPQGRRPRRAGGMVAQPRFVQLPQPGWPVTSAVRIALPGGAIVMLASHASAEMITAAVRAAMRAPDHAPGDTLAADDTPASEDRPC